MITDGVSNGNISTPLRYRCDRSRVRNAIAIAYGYSRQHTSFWKESNQVRQPSASSALLHMLLLLSALAPRATRSRRRPAPRTSSCATHFQLSIFSRPPALGIGCAKRSGFSRSRRRCQGRPGFVESLSRLNVPWVVGGGVCSSLRSGRRWHRGSRRFVARLLRSSDRMSILRFSRAADRGCVMASVTG